jgi:hypothetical protein
MLPAQFDIPMPRKGNIKTAENERFSKADRRFYLLQSVTLGCLLKIPEKDTE